MRNLELLKLLRERIPIGYMDAREMLREYDDDIDKIVPLLRQKYIAAVVARTRLQENIILPLLVHNKYDTAKTISQLEDQYRLIDGVPQTETVYALHRWSGHKEHAVNIVCSRILQQFPINRLDNERHDVHHFSWYVEKELYNLDTIRRCIVTITDWLDYEYWEDFSYAIHYYPELMAEQLRLVGLPQLAAALKFSFQISQEIRQKYPEDTGEHHSAYHNDFQQDEDFKNTEKYFRENRYRIMEHLFDFIKKHVDEFP